MKKGLTTLLVILLAVGAVLVSCKAEVGTPADELVSVSFEEAASRSITATLETFNKNNYYWKYAAKKADTSNLISGQTANYDSDPESGALWIKEGEPGFGVTSGELYTPFKVQGFSQGLWNFRLFGYKKVIGDNPATTEVVETDFEYYLLAYSGETTGVLLKQNGTNLVKAIVSPTQTGNGTLVVKITGTDKITLDPATPGLIPNTKIKLKVAKITSTATTTVFDDFVTKDYNESLEAGTYKVTVKFTNDDASVEFASGSVVSTVYANLTTTVKGNLTEVITSAIFGAEQNPDIITTSIGTAAITQGTTESSVTFTSTTATKVAATMPTAAAKSLIAAMEEELDAKTSSSTSQTSDLTLNLSVNTTEATETTVTYEIGMEATLIYEKKDAQASQKTTTKSTVETLDDFVTVVIDLRANLQDVSVTHSGTVMTECASLTELEGKTKAQDTTGIGFYFYDSASGKLYIKTWKFSPFQLSYTVPSYVAAIGSVRYTSLKAALDSVVEGDTVTLLSDINLEISKEDAVNVDGRYAAFLVKPFKNLTIDGNGKIITINTSDSDVKDVFSLDANGGTGGANIDNVWNIKNLTINATGFQTVILSNAEINKSHVANLDNVKVVTDGESIYANGEVTINVNGSTLTHSGEYAPGLDPVYYSAVIVGYNGRINLSESTINSFGNAVATFPSGGSVTLTDCNVSTTAVEGESISGNIIWSRNEDYSVYPDYTGSSIITVNSGNYDGAIYVSQGWESTKSSHLYAKVNINGGVFSDFAVTVSHASGCDIAEEDHVVITAGTYDADPSIYVADGYIADYSALTSKWTVREATEADYVASITRGELIKKYLSLPKAVEDAVDGDIVTLLKNVSVDDKVLVTKSITFDGNNKTISRIREAAQAGGCVMNFVGTENQPLNLIVKNLNVIGVNTNGIIFEACIDKSVVNDCSISTENRTPAYIGDGSPVNSVYVELNNTNMTMTGKRVGAPWGNTAIGVTYGATAIVTGGTYSGPLAAYIMSSGGKLTINEGSTFVSTGNSEYSGDGIRLDRNYWEVKKEGKGVDYSDSVLTINGGSFKGISHINLENSGNQGDTAWDDKVLVYINGGNFENYSIAGVSSPWCLASITGGTFDHDPSAYVADGYYAKYHPAAGTDPEYWTVESVPANAIFALINNGTKEVSFITASNFATITDNGTGVPANHTLKLLQNFQHTPASSRDLIAFNGNNITFDLNGHVFTFTWGSASGMFVANSSPENLVFKNGTITQTDKDVFGHTTVLFYTSYYPVESSFVDSTISYYGISYPSPAWDSRQMPVPNN